VLCEAHIGVSKCYEGSPVLETDITSEDALDEQDENGQSVEWTDVIDEVLKEMFEIWWCQYGGGTFRIHVFSLSPVWTDVHFPSER
jgi:hypothetical protein